MTLEAAAAQELVIVTGLFSLGGVVVGALLSPFTQFLIDWRRERGKAQRAKKLVAGELLHCQLILRTTADSGIWPVVDDAATARERLPSGMWEENRSDLVGALDDDLWNKLVMAYAALEVDRGRMILANKAPRERLTAEEAKLFTDGALKIGRLRHRLGGVGHWADDRPD